MNDINAAVWGPELSALALLRFWQETVWKR